MKWILFIAFSLMIWGCGDSQKEVYFLRGAWLLRHVEYPWGQELDLSLDGSGTYCLVYDSDSVLYECQITRSPTGLIVIPESMAGIKLMDKGGADFLYLENSDPHPLSIINDTTIIIQRSGKLYTMVRADDVYSEWGTDLRDIISNELRSNAIDDRHSYVLSAKERQQKNYINWLIMAFGLASTTAMAIYVVNRRRHRQMLLQLQQIQEVHENRPQPIRHVVAEFEKNYFASDEYAAFQKRMGNGHVMNDDEWQQVEQYLKTIYPGFSIQLRSLYPMSELEYHTCLLVKLRISTKDIASVLARDVSTISTMRKRLYKKVFGENGGAKEWDDFILSIGV